MTISEKLLLLFGLLIFCGGTSYFTALVVARRAVRDAAEMLAEALANMRVPRRERAAHRAGSNPPPPAGVANQAAPDNATTNHPTRTRAEFLRETDALYARTPQEAPPPRLTHRERWLMTGAYIAGKAPSSPESCGEWLRSMAEIPDRINGGCHICSTERSLANRAAVAFGEPGRTPEAS